MGIVVGMTNSSSPEFSVNEREFLANGVIVDLSRGRDSPRPLRFRYTKKQRQALARTLRAALDSDDERLEDADRALLPHLLDLFMS